MTVVRPDFVLYAQHGWADDRRAISILADRLITPNTQVIAPSLGFLNTWIRIQPLIQAVEQRAIATFATYPDSPMRIVGHSMGGLIWLEVLTRHPEWWHKVESLVLVGSPVGGADLARMLDPFGWGIGIARDLGLNRRPLAEAIAAQIPTLVIAGDVDGGSDGTIPVESTKVFGAQFVCLPGISHPRLKNHPTVAKAIQAFWRNPQQISTVTISEFAQRLIQKLHQVPGMTDGHWRGFRWAKVYCTLETGLTIRTWKNPFGIDHVFVACPEGICLYSGFVGWPDAPALHQVLREISNLGDCCPKTQLFYPDRRGQFQHSSPGKI